MLPTIGKGCLLRFLRGLALYFVPHGQKPFLQYTEGGG